MPKPEDSSKRGDDAKLQWAGKMLHDDVGPLLSAAGLKLHLLSMDFPDAGPMAVEVTAMLEEAMDRVRELSRELRPPPDYSKASSAGLSRPGRVVRRKRS
jgi:signal transduction histidine kinase